MGTIERWVLLAVQRLNGKGYAVTIADDIELRANRDMSLSATYVVLDRLSRKGFVSSKFGEATAERGGKRKRLYQITGLGERALRESIEVEQQMWAGVPAGARA